MTKTNPDQLMLLCVFAAFISLGGSVVSGQDWLGPEFEQPLPQYDSTTQRAVEAPLSGTVNAPENRPANSSTAKPEPIPAAPTRMMNSPGVNLAPNPLKSLLEGRELETGRQIKPLPPKPKAVQTPSFEKAEPAINSPEPPSRSLPRPKATSPKTSTRNKKKPVAAPMRPVLGYDIYRDTNVFPLDHRKPNNPCTQGPSCGCNKCRLPGVNGKPFQPKEPGGYNCGKNCPHKRPKFSVYWPRPFSAKLDERHPARAAARYSGRQTKKIIDAFDCLANFQLLSYERVDNGYTGRESDPYGCLGESKIAGLGFRPPGVPNNPSQPAVGYPPANY